MAIWLETKLLIFKQAMRSGVSHLLYLAPNIIVPPPKEMQIAFAHTKATLNEVTQLSLKYLGVTEGQLKFLASDPNLQIKAKEMTQDNNPDQKLRAVIGDVSLAKAIAFMDIFLSEKEKSLKER